LASGCGKIAAVSERSKFHRNALLFWPVLFALAFGNASLRELVLVPLAGRAVALPISGLTLMAILGIAIWWFMLRHQRATIADAALAGLIWFVLTLAAEAGLALASGQPAIAAARLFTPAAILAGDLFAVVVVFVAVWPAAIVRLRGR
jgi:hypothetical protein